MSSRALCGSCQVADTEALGRLAAIFRTGVRLEPGFWDMAYTLSGCLKVERPGGGDVYRSQVPVFIEGESVSFLTLNRGKRSIVLNLRDEHDRDRLRLTSEARCTE